MFSRGEVATRTVGLCVPDGGYLNQHSYGLPIDLHVALRTGEPISARTRDTMFS